MQPRAIAKPIPVAPFGDIVVATGMVLSAAGAVVYGLVRLGRLFL